MLDGNTTREVESDTAAEQELKTVKRDCGGLNEGIWPKSSLGHQTMFGELCSLNRSEGSSTGLFRKYMLAGNTTRDVESDTAAEQEQKTVKRDFGGLNERIWPKISLGHQTRFGELCSLDRSEGSSTGLLRKYMLAGNTTREVESDTAAEQELKTVKRDCGGLNEGIWPKSSLGHQMMFGELCSLNRSEGSSTGLLRKYTKRKYEDTIADVQRQVEPAGALKGK
ncbi:hypothetical protein F511_35693 [Dorcoceras hygrometricum]|uniref:Uncharacterized protein n=1 Tax=Dorcoceras hygrometricum TaxID=472368 RepID=A0A2Z7APK0_9LAMI|nr:hypothetical protein F511_35693 [Dorcoceras hygrometricum]